MKSLVLWPLLAALPALGQEPRVTATASKTDVTVGETFLVTLRAEALPGAAFRFPDQAGDESVELLADLSPSAPPAEAAVAERRYQAAVFAVGDVQVPPVTVGYRLADGTEGESSTAPISLRVLSVLPRDPREQKLADVRGPLPLSVGRAFWIVLAVLLLLLGGLLAWLWKRRRRAARPVPQVPGIAPDAEARAALDRLASAGHLARGEYRPYYIALAEIAKRYLERRLGAPVLEMTSAETVAFLRNHPQAGALAGTVRDLAGAADQVKFARGPGQGEEAERHLQSLRRLVDDLEIRLRPAEPAGEKVA